MAHLPAASQMRRKSRHASGFGFLVGLLGGLYGVLANLALDATVVERAPGSFCERCRNHLRILQKPYPNGADIISKSGRIISEWCRNHIQIRQKSYPNGEFVGVSNMKIVSKRFL